MLHWNVHDRVFRRRQRAANLRIELLLRRCAPVVGDKDKSALQQVIMERPDFLAAEIRRAGVFQNHPRALEQLGIGEPDRDVIGIAQLRPFIFRDVRFGQLR